MENDEKTYIAIIGSIEESKNVFLRRMPQFHDVLHLSIHGQRVNNKELQIYEVTKRKPLTCRILFQMTNKKSFIQFTFEPEKLTVVTHNLDAEEYIYRILRYFLIKTKNKVNYLLHP